MNKDIQTLIEREAENGIGVLHPLDKQSLSLDGKYYWENHFKKGFNAGAHFALSLFKWRKVSEGLPEVKNEAYQVLVYRKYKKEEYKMDTLWIIPDMSVSDSFKFHGVSEWKPIPQID